ncbi:MAG: glycosyltransferase family 4 protein [Pseudomonadota bacterium]
MFVLPTFADCFSLVIMEALASGMPVVATRVGGIPDMGRGGQDRALARGRRRREVGRRARIVADGSEPTTRNGRQRPSRRGATLRREGQRTSSVRVRTGALLGRMPAAFLRCVK